VQTFLPDPNFEISAALLDSKRLGKQRVEAEQILFALLYGGGWKHHAATRMWRGYEPALAQYRDCMIREWIARGYRNTMPLVAEDLGEVPMPPWLGDPEFHASQRSNLLRKDPEFYSQYGWSEPTDLPYVWPTP
jgi:Pyrimidine dimer DNA glycosylase